LTLNDAEGQYRNRNCIAAARFLERQLGFLIKWRLTCCMYRTVCFDTARRPRNDVGACRMAWKWGRSLHFYVFSRSV